MPDFAARGLGAALEGDHDHRRTPDLLMPQPAIHLLLARETLERWAARRNAPVDIDSVRVRNAFLHGTLAPDMGNFPGGDPELARAVHTRRTGAVVRELFAAARTEQERAFAWGWLSHVLADAAIHPLVNVRAAASSNGTPLLIEHVRVEVGLDAWFCWQHPMLDGVRLVPAFDAGGYAFLAGVLGAAIERDIGGVQLARMERGLIRFSHAAVHFARRVARIMCWGEEGPPVPLPSAALWHAASRLSPAGTTAHAYLNPRRPDAALIARTEKAIAHVHREFDGYVAAGVDRLPDYNLEDGSLVSSAVA